VVICNKLKSYYQVAWNQLSLGNVEGMGLMETKGMANDLKLQTHFHFDLQWLYSGRACPVCKMPGVSCGGFAGFPTFGLDALVWKWVSLSGQDCRVVDSNRFWLQSGTSINAPFDLLWDGQALGGGSPFSPSD